MKSDLAQFISSILYECENGLKVSPTSTEGLLKDLAKTLLGWFLFACTIPNSYSVYS